MSTSENKIKGLMIVLPTYNERGNLEKLVREIFSLDIKDTRIGIAVVDDASPDGTGPLADRLSEVFPQLHVIHRTGPRGRGRAGIEGFQYAVARGSDYVMEMDADGSHQPRFIPHFVEAIRRCDVVIGSRGVPGGCERGRNRARKLVTRFANMYLRMILGVRVKDCTSGYRCFRREALEKIDLDTLRSTGPSLVEEILVRCSRAGCRIEEIPIEFIEREGGESTFNVRILISCFLRAIQFRFHRPVKPRV